MENTQQYVDYIVEQAKAILAIDSPSGFTEKVTDYLVNEYSNLGYKAYKTVKGGVVAELGGNDTSNAVLLEAHVDTLGGMVAEIKDNGRLRLTNIGGLTPNNIETENCRVYTKTDAVYEGTCQLINPSLHTNNEYKTIQRTFDTIEIVLDEQTSNREETLALGIQNGDFVCFDTVTKVTAKGYIKSRFLDDKLSAAILLGFAKYVKDNNIVLPRNMYHHLTVYEEVGYGASASVPEGVTEVLAVDMGCIGEGVSCTEQQVSICAKDTGGPYNYEMVSRLTEVAQKMQLDYSIDVYPYYGSDVEATLRAGYDIKHGLIGPGVYASHGYERSHVKGVENTLKLLLGYFVE